MGFLTGGTERLRGDLRRYTAAGLAAVLLGLFPLQAPAQSQPAHHLEGGGYTNPGYVDGGRPGLLSGLAFFAGRIARVLRPVGRAADSVDDGAAMFDRYAERPGCCPPHAPPQ